MKPFCTNHNNVQVVVINSFILELASVIVVIIIQYTQMMPII